MKRIFLYIKEYRYRIAIGTTIKFIGTIMDLFIPWILAHIIDVIIPTKDLRLLTFWSVLMLLFSAIALVGNVIANRMASKVARDTTQRVRHDLFAKIEHLSCRQMDSFTVPSLEARLTTDTYHLHQMIGMLQRLGLRSPILLLGGMVVTLSLEPVLALVLIATLPLIGWVAFWVSRKGVPLFRKLQQAVDQLVRTVREDASGIRIIKALSKSDYEKQRFNQINRHVVERETNAAVMMATGNPIINLILNIGLSFVILVGAWRANRGLTQTGQIIAFLSYFTIMSMAMISLARIFTYYTKGSASAERIRQVLEAEEEPLVHPSDPIQTDAHILFDHVSFSYNGKYDQVTDLDFALKRGQTLGIIGPTGCGKTTLINLLMRFYDPQKGTIRISGERLDAIPLDQLYTKLGVVFQNDVLFAESIEENIRFGRALDREQVAEAAHCAQAADFIAQIEEGYDYPLTAKGTNLSGGQKQRLLIARALAGTPEILILDDSSSALDYQTDARLRTALRERYAGVTTIIVAQRISSIRHADLILVLDRGRVIGAGNHEHLMESCGEYRQISHSQMGGEDHA